jgi:superfamily II DNA/RNA helicase
MPTGAGKTTLCETLLFDHSQRHPLEVAVLLVPYRSLASELRGGVVRRLNGLGISSRCAYGGTVPSGDEVHALDETRIVVATPEALSGLLSADQQFLRRISLVICDEGHLLGAPSRGIALELLLARLKTREGAAPRFVFISAIVPNIHEINTWLGGTADSVVRSEYRPALADFGLLRARNTPAGTVVDLAVHPHLPEPLRFTVEGFLTHADFRFTNPNTGRLKTFPFTSIKTRAVAAARKALPLGAVVIFAANKRGEQGAIGIAEELLEQLTNPLTLPNPEAFANTERLSLAIDYVRREFGDTWIGTRALAAAAVLHHGDVPQETREVLEDLLRRGHVMFAVCTNTLAEGVNLPIRTLVLYSVQRRSGAALAPLLSRDIKNLVGRAGRAGATTKGLVVCANDAQWPDVARVALEQPGENLVSALRELVDRLRQVLALHNTPLTNENLEATPSLHTLVDGIDSTLIDLASEEITQEALEQLAAGLADQTFAAQSAGEPSRELLRTVFRLRATRVANLRATGRLVWIRQTGARMRMIEIVEMHLFNAFGEWETLENPIQDQFVGALLEWAWQHGQLENDMRQVYRLEPQEDVNTVRNSFFAIVRHWVGGYSYAEIAAASGNDVNDVLSVLTGAVTYGLQSVIEQGLSLLGKLLESQGRELSAAVRAFPDHLRFGVPTASARLLSAFGIRHRRAAILLGNAAEIQAGIGNGRETLFAIIHTLLANNAPVWRERLGALMYENTVVDVS